MAEGSEKEYLTPTRMELVWPSKRTQVERIALPFQVVETINQSRATREQTPMLAGLPPPPLFEGQSTADTAWRNKLIWGDNKYVVASLLQGDPSIKLEPLAGKIDLIYIDPPFATGDDFRFSIKVGDYELTKEPSIIEEKAYRDTWGHGVDSYLQMMYERFIIMRDLLADTGVIWVHCDWRMNFRLRMLLDEIFGQDRLVNEVIWRRKQAVAWSSKMFGVTNDTLLWYSKSDDYYFTPEYTKDDENTQKYIRERFIYDDGDGRKYMKSPLVNPLNRPNLRYEFHGVQPPTTGWLYSRERMEEMYRNNELVIPSTPKGRIYRKIFLDDYQGQPIQNIWTDIPIVNPMALERTGYDTQKPEALLKRIILSCSPKDALVADFFCGSGTTMAVAEKLGRRWIGCDLSRFAIQVTRKRLLDIPDCKPFEVLNLGRYERRHWQMNVLNGEQEDGSKAIADYLRFIVALYHAEPVEGYVHLHGQKAGRWVHVGATDAAVTRAEIMDAVRECQAHRYTAIDVLGWEWEMGLHDTIRDEARRLSVDLRLLYIPREVMDKRAVEAGDVHFYELAYLNTSLLQDGQTVTVRLDDFVIPNPDLVPDEVRIKVKKWSDYIDFWAVDWNYAGDTFHNEWQTYRIRKSPILRLISDPHTYPEPRKYRILVKVIDIFGNDTTQLLEVAIA